MKLLSRFIIPSILASLCLLAAPATAPAQVTSGPPHGPIEDAPTKAEAASLKKKNNKAQARIGSSHDGTSDQVQLNKTESKIGSGHDSDQELNKTAAITGPGKHSHAGDAPSKADAASLQKKANKAQAITGDCRCSDQGDLMKAVQTNNVALAKKVLLRNGFTAKDLENAKISLRTGRGMRGSDQARVTIHASGNTIFISPEQFGN